MIKFFMKQKEHRQEEGWSKAEILEPENLGANVGSATY